MTGLRECGVWHWRTLLGRIARGPARESVCDGCWLRGRCTDPETCRCPCLRDGWEHADGATR